MPYNTKLSVVHYIAALALAVGSHQQVLAANDWLVPCTRGKCSWDLPADSGASGTLHIVRSCIALSRADVHFLIFTIHTLAHAHAVGPHHRDLGYHQRDWMADHALRPDRDGAGHPARVR